MSGQLSQASFINVLGWYPEFDRENFYRLHTDETLENPVFETDFLLPPASAAERWWASLPDDYQREDSNEFLIVLASKEPFRVIAKESRSDFFKRLDEFGRENWRIARYSYRIVK